MINPKNHTVIIGISGGSGAGKTFLTKSIQQQLLPIRSEILSQDFYYKDQRLIPLTERVLCNYDEPEAIDFDLLMQNLTHLKHGRTAQRPIYNFILHNRDAEWCTVEPAPVIIVDGILIYSYDALQPFFDLRVFVDTPPDVRLMRRLQRDVHERGRSMESVLSQYEKTVSPMHKRYVEPARAIADISINGCGNLQIISEMIAFWIRLKIEQSDE